MDKRVIFKEEICKGCELCINVCPTNVIKVSEKINVKGYHPAIVENQDGCISCAACARICPDSVITVYRPIKRKNAS